MTPRAGVCSDQFRVIPKEQQRLSLPPETIASLGREKKLPYASLPAQGEVRAIEQVIQRIAFCLCSTWPFL